MIGILAEKPSQARNFAAALGGMSGTYNGEQYVIVPARGHLYEFQTPDVQVPAYKSWSLANLPWDEELFNWKRMPKKDTKDAISNIKNTLSGCDEICIGTDLDPTGEGDLLAIEVLQELKLQPQKFTRMHFTDESAKEVQKAFVNRFVIPDLEKYPDYIKANFRCRWDFLSMQFTRIATLTVGQPKAVLRQGRLKSAMVVIVGDQLKAIAEYVKKPYYMNKFRDENNVVYTNPEEPMFENKEDVPNIYNPSSVTVDSKTRKTSAPPKLIDLATLAGMLAPKGFKSADVLATYQKLYEAKIVSYPRTEDKYITPEQFNELLPLTDKICAVVGVDPSLVSHRTPRNTHVKTGCAHGANRPGPNVPSSLESLDTYGKCAPAIYEILAKNYLAMMGEDYEYEQQKGHVTDYPKFKGTANVPLSLGYKKIFSDMDEPDEDESAGLGTHAEPFIYEGCNPKPQTPTAKWLFKQLEKHDVGTGATRTSTYADVTSTKTNCPLLVDTKGKISMTEYGEMSYKVLPGTHIGDLAITERVMNQMKEIAAGKLNPEACLKEIRQMVVDDIATMQANAKNAGIQSAPAQKEKASGLFNGQQVQFNREWSGHRFTDDEVQRLLNGEEIELYGVIGKSGKSFDVKGKLTQQTYNGKSFFGFEKTEFLNNNANQADRCTGMFNGKQISFKKEWGGHKFTDDECQRLLNGEEIEITGLVSKSGSTYGVKGKLAEQTYNGNKYFGFLKTGFAGNNNGGAGGTQYPQKEKYSGTFKGKQVSFNRTWGGHRFTDDECEALLRGEEITITGLQSKSGSTYGVKGKLKKQSYNGNPFYGFDKTDFV